jgi:hypothetical protein
VLKSRSWERERGRIVRHSSFPLDSFPTASLYYYTIYKAPSSSSILISDELIAHVVKTRLGKTCNCN